jgi:hypothetical protein
MGMWVCMDECDYKWDWSKVEASEAFLLDISHRHIFRNTHIDMKPEHVICIIAIVLFIYVILNKDTICKYWSDNDNM